MTSRCGSVKVQYSSGAAADTRQCYDRQFEQIRLRGAWRGGDGDGIFWCLFSSLPTPIRPAKTIHRSYSICQIVLKRYSTILVCWSRFQMNVIKCLRARARAHSPTHTHTHTRRTHARTHARNHARTHTHARTHAFILILQPSGIFSRIAPVPYIELADRICRQQGHSQKRW